MFARQVMAPLLWISSCTYGSAVAPDAVASTSMAFAPCIPMRATAPRVGLRAVVLKTNCFATEKVEGEYVVPDFALA